MAMAADHLSELRRTGMEIKHAVEAAVTVVHPDEAGLTGIYGTIFTGPPAREDSHLRNVTVFAEAEVDRSPCGTGTCAVLAVLDAMGLVDPDRPFVHESLIGLLGFDYTSIGPDDFGEEEQGWWDNVVQRSTTIASHMAVHSSDPQTLSYGLNDSPAGLLAWLLERRRAWSDCDGEVERVFPRDDLLTLASIYWLTGTIGTSCRSRLWS